jgi:hypothetical protein
MSPTISYSSNILLLLLTGFSAQADLVETALRKATWMDNIMNLKKWGVRLKIGMIWLRTECTRARKLAYSVRQEV